MARTTFLTLRTQVRERLGETAVADFWTDTEVNEEINKALEQFTNEEKWHWLLTSGTATLTSGTHDITLPPGVDQGNVSSILMTASGQIRPYLLVKVTPEKGFELRQWYYFNSGWPTWFYMSSVEVEHTDEVMTLVNAGSTTGNFTITFEGQTTGNIARGATAETIQTALEALSNIAPGDIAVTGGPLASDTITIAFLPTGTLGDADRTLITLGGTTTSLTAATSVAGGLAGQEFENVIRVIPTASRTFTAEFLYYLDTPELVSDTDVPRIPDQYTDAIVSWATYKLWLKELNGQAKAMEQLNLYNQVLKMAITDQRTQSNDDLLVVGKDEPQFLYKDKKAYSQFRMPTTLGP